MKLRNTLMALVVLAGLVAFIYYYEYRGEEAREAAKTAAENVFTLKSDTVQEVDIERAAATGAGAPARLVLRREAEGWRIEEPIKTRADSEKIESMVSSLGYLRIERTLENVPDADREGFKLKDPALKVTLKLKEGTAGGTDLSLFVGEKAPFGGSYYAAKPGSHDVLLVSGGVDSVLSADAASLRYKKLIGIDAWKVARFKVEKEGRTVALAKQGDEWRLESPVSFPADGSKVQGLWYDLQAAEADSFEADHPSSADLERLGLARPALTLTVEATEGAQPIRVALAVPAASGSVNALRSDLDVVMIVKKDLFDKIDKLVSAPDDLRDARVAPVDRFKISGIDIQRAGAPAVSLLKDQESTWHSGSKEGPVLPSEEVNALLDAVEALKAERYADSPAVAPETGSDLTLALHEGEDEKARVVTVRLAPAAKEAGAPERRATSSASASVYLVPSAAAQTLLDRAAAIKQPSASQPSASTPAPSTAAPAAAAPSTAAPEEKKP